jgi:hypothetical protein
MSRLSPFGLAAALAAVLAAGPSVRAAEPDKLLPADAEFVVSINVKQIVDSDIVKKYALGQIKQALQGADARKFLTDLGLDPLKDVERLVVGGSGKDSSDVKALTVLHGKFDPEKLFKAAEAQTKKDPDHFSLVKDGKDVMFKYQPETGNPVYGTAVDETTVILGTEKKLVSTALAATGKKPAVSKDLAALLAKMDDKASLWGVWVSKDKLNNAKFPKGGGAPPGLAEQIQKMETVAAVVRVTADISFEVTFGMPNADSADEFSKMIDDMLQQAKGALPFLAAMQPQLKPLVEVVKTIKSATKDKAVVVTGKMAGSAIGELLKVGGGE